MSEPQPGVGAGEPIRDQQPFDVAFTQRVFELQKEWTGQVHNFLLQNGKSQDELQDRSGELHPVFKKVRLPISIDPAEELTVTAAYKSKDGHSSWFSVGLYQDGSPFMIEEDLAEVNPEEGMEGYVIFVGAEYRPFIVAHARVGSIREQRDGNGPEAYMRYLQATKGVIRYLTDDECQALTEALPSLEIDFAETYVANE